MNIVDAIRDENLFLPFFSNDLASWRPWVTALRVLYGLPVKTPYGRNLIRQCTGRDPDKLPANGFQTALFLTGRRSGKSRIAAVIGAYAAALAGLESKLATGERGIVPVVSPSKRQSHVVKDYLRAIFNAPMLKQEIAHDRKWEGFTLHNGTQIEMLAGDYRHVRGFSLLACVVEEICFFGLDDDSRVRSDSELVRALQPALATTGGRLIGISSPYAKRGWAWNQYGKHFGKDDSDVLVWNAPSRVMNPTLPQSVVDAAMAEDMAAALSEYGGQFRDDVGIFISPEMIEKLVVTGRPETLPQSQHRYFAFVDMSAGRHDDAAVAIAHRENRKVILDYVKAYKPPFNPHAVIGQISDELRRWGIKRIQGDNYAGDFVNSAFASNGMQFANCDKNKSALYAELLPILTSGEIEILDQPKLVKQLSCLERRTRSGGKDVIDHPPNSHDDLANAVAGVAVLCTAKRIVCGTW